MEARTFRLLRTDSSNNRNIPRPDSREKYELVDITIKSMNLGSKKMKLVTIRGVKQQYSKNIRKIQSKLTQKQVESLSKNFISPLANLIKITDQL